MDEEHASEVPVGASGASQQSRWAAFRKPKVWIPVAAGVSALAIVMALVVTQLNGTSAAAAPSDFPTPTQSLSPSATSAPTNSPSASAAPTASVSASPVPPDDYAPEDGDGVYTGWIPPFVVPGINSASDDTAVSIPAAKGAAFNEPLLSRDGSHVAMVFSGSNLVSVYVGKTDGSALTQLPKVNADYEGLVPAWSPDGKRLAYITGAAGAPVLTVVNADGSGSKNVASLPVEVAKRCCDKGGAFLSWSFDGKKIAVSYGGLNQVITDTHAVVVDVAAGSVKPVAAGAGAATFSPKDSTLGYIAADASGHPTMYLTKDGTTLAQIPFTLDVEWGPWSSKLFSFSPDGKHVAWSETGLPDITAQLHVMNSDGTHDQPFGTFGGGPGAWWSPDSTKILFADNWDVRYVDANGNHEQVVSGVQTNNSSAVYARWATNSVITLPQAYSATALSTSEDLAAWSMVAFDSEHPWYIILPNGDALIADGSSPGGTATVTIFHGE